MAINFPTSLDTFSNPIGTDLLENATTALDHDVQHSNANDAIEALEAKVGVTNSAVTTTHDYKLSGVATGDKAVSKTGTETLTNKTLTAPQINMGSDAAGDMYYRSLAGVFTRLPLGTTGQILNVDGSGIPAWIANPSAADASTTVKGVSEIATTAEITAGTATGGTGAVLVIPASAVGSPGASKLVQYTAGGLYPAADGSLITNISGSGISTFQRYGGVGDGTTAKTFNNFMIPWLLTTDVPTGNYWSTTNVSIVAHFGYLEFNAGSDANFAVITTKALGCVISGGSNADLMWSTGKDVYAEWTMQQTNASGSEQYGFGLAATTAPFFAYNDATVAAACFTIDTSGNLYAHTSNGGGGADHTETQITGITRTANTTYRVEFEAGVACRFYVNGVLKQTVTTTLPAAASAIKWGMGGTGNHLDGDRQAVGTVWVAVEK